MALTGVHSVVIPGKKEEPLIFTLDVPGGKKRLCVRKLSLWSFVAILSIGSWFSISLGVPHFRVYLEVELALGASACWPLPSHWLCW